MIARTTTKNPLNPLILQILIQTIAASFQNLLNPKNLQYCFFTDNIVFKKKNTLINFI